MSIKKLLFALIISFKLSAAFDPGVKAQILYLIHSGKPQRGFELYLSCARECGEEDYELLQEAALRLLESGMLTNDKETQLMCIFGAGVSSHPALLPMLAAGLKSKEMRISLAALHFLERFNDDAAHLRIKEAIISSPFLLVRLEAAYMLAKAQNDTIIEPLEALYWKSPPIAKPLFAQILAPLTSSGATHFFERLLTGEEREVQLMALREAGMHKRDDLLMHIRNKARHSDVALQEAALFSLALLRDHASKELFEQFTTKKSCEMRLLSFFALSELGEKQYLPCIEQEAQKENLFAISLLGKCDEGDFAIETLKKLLESGDAFIRLNAAIALLERGNSACLPTLRKIFFTPSLETIYTERLSSGGGLAYWTTQLPAPKGPPPAALNLLFREQLLSLCIDLPEEDFLLFSREIFEHYMNDLVPTLVSLLISQGSDEAISLLKEMQHKAGAPLIRNYCSLGLYELNVEGPYEEQITHFLQDAANHPLIRFREESEPTLHSPHCLTPEETSQLLIASFETLASKRHATALQALVRAIACGNPKNRYALAGLLLRAAE